MKNILQNTKNSTNNKKTQALKPWNISIKWKIFQ